MAKKQGSFYFCLIPGCGVKKKWEKEVLGHIVMDHHQVAERNRGQTGTIADWDLRPSELRDIPLGWQGAYRYGLKVWKAKLDAGIINEWGVTQTKKGWRKGVPRKMKGKAVEQVEARDKLSLEKGKRDKVEPKV